MTKPRKGPEYVSLLEVLMRDAQQPTYAEIIEGERDPRKRQERQRARDIATDELIRIRRDRKTYGALSGLHKFGVDQFIKQLKRARRQIPDKKKRFPIRKGGRPSNEHQRLLCMAKMAELVKGGATADAAIKSVYAWSNKRFGAPASVASMKAIYYETDPDWKDLVRIELARRAYEARVDKKSGRRASMRARKRRPVPKIVLAGM